MKTKKRSIAAILLLLFISSALAACGGNDTQNAGSGSSASPSGSASAASGGKKLRAAFITPQKLGDKGPIDLAYSGFEKGGKEFGIEMQTVEANKGEYEESVRAMAQKGYDLIIALNPDLLDAVDRVAPDFPNTKFGMIIAEADHPNVTSVLSKEQEGSFLAGVLAASMSKTGKVGFLGGVDNPEINRFYAGYQQGAKAINPDIQVTPVYVGGFEDPTKGKELSLLLNGQGNDVVYQAAAKSGLGLFDAIKESGKYAIGVDVNQNDLVPGQVLGSMVIRYDQWIYNLMKQLSEGTLQAGITWHDLKDGMIDLETATPEQMPIPEDVLKSIADYKAKIVSGEIKVNDVPEK